MVVKTQVYEYRLRRVRRSLACDLEQRISNGRELAALFRAFCPDMGREHAMVAVLDNRNAVIGVEIVAVGDISRVDMCPRELFRSVILSGGRAIVLAHNHPSGDATPSLDDLTVTRRIFDAGELLGFPLLDSLVVTERDHESIVEQLGLVPTQ